MSSCIKINEGSNKITLSRDNIGSVSLQKLEIDNGYRVSIYNNKHIRLYFVELTSIEQATKMYDDINTLVYRSNVAGNITLVQ